MPFSAATVSRALTQIRMPTGQSGDGFHGRKARTREGGLA